MNREDYEQHFFTITASFQDADGKCYTSGDKRKYSFGIGEFLE